MLDLDSAGVAKPLNFVGMWVLRLGQLELGAKFFTCEVMTTPSIDDDLDGPSIDDGLGMEYMASLVFFLLMLKGQDLGDNESGARIIVTKDLVIFIFIHLPVHGHVHKGFQFFFTHGVVSAVVIGDHGAPMGALKSLVALISTCEAFDGTRLDGLIRSIC